MPPPQLGYLKFAIAAVFWAYALAILILAIPATALGHSHLETPLLLSFVAVTSTSLVIAVCITRWLGDATPQPYGETRDIASAMFTFSNAVGTLASLVGQIFKCFEMGWRDRQISDRDALSILLDQLGYDGIEKFVIYLFVCAILAVFSLLLVRSGAKVYKDRGTERSKAGGVAFISIILMTFGILVGTPWQPALSVEEGLTFARSTGAFLVTIAIIVFGVAIMAAMLIFATQHLAYLLSGRAYSIDPSPARESSGHVLARIAFELVIGLILAVAGIMILWRGAISYLLWVEKHAEFSGEQIESLNQSLAASFDIFVTAAAGAVALLIIGAIALLMVALTALGLLFFKATRLWLSSTIPTVVIVSKRMVRSIQSLVDAVQLLRSQPRSERPHSSFPANIDQNSSVRSPAKSDATISEPQMAGPLTSRRLNGVSFAFALLMSLFAVYFIAARYLDDSGDTASIAEVVEAAQETLDEVAQPVGYESAKPFPVAICEPPVGTLNWALSSTDKLEIALDDCRLADEVRAATDGVLVIVSVASMGPNSNAERELAMRRGIAIAQWASYRTPVDMPIYVLNLGMARRAEPFIIGWRQFGAVSGERPVLGMLIRPYPEGTAVPTTDILNELSQNLSLERVQANFTDCELFAFDADREIGTQLQIVPEFSCSPS